MGEKVYDHAVIVNGVYYPAGTSIIAKSNTQATATTETNEEKPIKRERTRQTK